MCSMTEVLVLNLIRRFIRLLKPRRQEGFHRQAVLLSSQRLDAANRRAPRRGARQGERGARWQALILPALARGHGLLEFIKERWEIRRKSRSTQAPTLLAQPSAFIVIRAHALLSTLPLRNSPAPHRAQRSPQIGRTSPDLAGGSREEIHKGRGRVAQPSGCTCAPRRRSVSKYTLTTPPSCE
jgi:hypothetical protein